MERKKLGLNQILIYHPKYDEYLISKKNIATEYLHFVMSALALEVSFVKSFLCDYDALMYDLSKFMTSS